MVGVYLRFKLLMTDSGLLSDVDFRFFTYGDFRCCYPSSVKMPYSSVESLFTSFRGRSMVSYVFRKIIQRKEQSPLQPFIKNVFIYLDILPPLPPGPHLD